MPMYVFAITLLLLHLNIGVSSEAQFDLKVCILVFQPSIARCLKELKEWMNNLLKC